MERRSFKATPVIAGAMALAISACGVADHPELAAFAPSDRAAAARNASPSRAR
jgi:hypothetical protein